ncbi:MAG: type III pantothenate kinase [Verrucomicrobiae bacterium]|nr:type III pantothenate kinase [Verrucomicrobiae bacterium]
MKPGRPSPRTLPPESTALLLDIGNTHCHVGLATPDTLVEHTDLPTPSLIRRPDSPALRRFLATRPIQAVVLCSVVPKATRALLPWLRSRLRLKPLVLTARTVRGIGIDYPSPETIGPDRLANALAVHDAFGAPSVVVDFGTAVTFDIVDASARYVGGIIAPGLAAMTDYLHEKTALLPRIRIRDVASPIGRSTEEAMLIGAVHGYRGLVRELIRELRHSLGVRRLPVVATGGYADLIARDVTDITTVRPHLTLEGLRLHWLQSQLAS